MPPRGRAGEVWNNRVVGEGESGVRHRTTCLERAVIASPKPPQGGRVHLGAPIVPMNPSGRYLRHRVAAERTHAARRRGVGWSRGAAVVLLCLFYLAIGRDLVAVAKAKTGTAKMEIRSEVHQLT